MNFENGQTVIIRKDTIIISGDLLFVQEFSVTGLISDVDTTFETCTLFIARYGRFFEFPLKKLEIFDANAAKISPENSLRVYADAPAGIDAPKKSGDAGYDLRADRDGWIHEGHWEIFETAAVEIPDGYCGLIIGRSSLNVRGILCVFGLIDSGYRGKIKVMLYTLDHYAPENAGPTIKRGDRIAQLVIVPVQTLPLLNVASLADLSPTERGASGFGSTNLSENTDG